MVVSPATDGKGKHIKRQVPCPLCPARSFWILRHLRCVHNIGKNDAQFILNSTDYYKKKSAGARDPKVSCPIAGCVALVTRINDHLRRIHHTSQTQLGIARKSRKPVIETVQSIQDCSSYNVVKSCAAIAVDDLIENDDIPLCDNSIDLFDQNDADIQQDVESCPAVNAEVVSRIDCIVPKSDSISSVIQSFKCHMGSIDGGAKASPNMYALGVQQIMQAIGGDLSLITKDSVRILYLEPLLSKSAFKSGMSVKTVKNKLKFFEYFCKFLITTYSEMEINGSKDWLKEINALLSVLPAWRQSLRNKCSLEEVQRRVLDNRERITPTDLSAYKVSEFAVYANSLLMNADKSVADKVSNYDFTRGRNHVIALLCISNAQRTGVLSNFSITDYREGIKEANLKKSDFVVFTVAGHKTTSSHGAAVFAANEGEARLLKGYMDLRQQLSACQDVPYVFVNYTGTRMTQSNIASALTAAFSKSGYSSRVNCTKLRKTTVTEIHKNHPEKRIVIADHMCHRPGTSDKSYRFNEKIDNAILCSELIRKALTNNDSSCIINSINSAAELAPLTSCNQSENISSLLGIESSFSPVVSCQQTDSTAAGALTSDMPKPYQKRILWSIENRDIVRAKFEQFVVSERTPINEIRKILFEDPALVSKLEKDLNLSGDNLVHSVKDKIRSFFRKKYGFKYNKRK